MCGIFAYLNWNVARDRKFILEALFGGLRRLEYRGYDSAGISIDADTLKGFHGELVANGNISEAQFPFVFKKEGKVSDLVAHVYKEVSDQSVNLTETFNYHAGIAHTRWATHGQPSAKNSHPQTSGPENEFVVVHNGIITNYVVLKQTLLRKGFEFESETDTEVIPKLTKYVYDQLTKDKKGDEVIPFRQVVVEVLRQLEGAYALIFKSSHYPNEIVACKRGSPMLLGVKDYPESADQSADDTDPLSPKSPIISPANDAKKLDLPFLDAGSPASVTFRKEYFIASDATAILEHTKKVMVLEDDDIVHIHDGIAAVFHFNHDVRKEKAGRPDRVQRALHTLEMEVEQIMKGNYEHYMQKEIHEQPDSLTTTMRGRLTSGEGGKPKGVVLGGLKEHVDTIRRSRRIIFIGCGTSYHAALASRQIIEQLSGVPVTMELASDLLDRQCPIFREDTAVFVSQSGETADTLLALEYAKKRGALCVGVTNTVGSAIARGTHCGVHINAGAEIGVASTKAYTSQIAVMTMIALALGQDSISNREMREAIIDDLLRLPEKVREVLKLDEAMRELARELVNEQSLLVFGRGYNYATALEAALKVKEVALMHSEGILAGEMKHGPLALVDETMPIIVLATRDAIQQKQQSVIQQLLARKGRLIIVCTEGDSVKMCPSGKAKVIEVPHIADCLQTVVNIVPLQLLSYHLTVLRGFNVDQPRNLAKSVTTE
ncbi:Glucosamine 6-phosphate synthetases [Klebsormidium nitens]|uniref:glutamine--fructose-6-phosphate transaminase (isomerizing) n=1 Tax=Klebsormidium nitens TaxID=105231 RepID=A0A1Y1HX85_KLENI|nr:Glucosamine 6-phosphate synthetases [Klebsormidium nitens]|eukprot:GAQ81147.1 Glucosamine 6-phosphate synthetases [Klebsormidium nitens]